MRDTSIILKIDGPCRPQRSGNRIGSEWPEKVLASKPARPAYAFDHIRDGSTGKLEVPYRARLVDRAEDRSGLDPCRVHHSRSALTGAGNVTSSNGDSDALAFLSVLLPRMVTNKPVSVSAISATSSATTPNGETRPQKPSKSNARSRSPARLSGAVATMPSILPATARGFLVPGAAECPADTSHRGLNPFASVGVWIPASL